MIVKYSFRRTVVATINLTHADWQLYDLPGAKEAATKLNRALEQAIADAGSAHEAMTKLDPTLRAYDNLGAYDTEPRNVARNLCIQAYTG